MFKSGDQVKIREDLEIGQRYGGLTFLQAMALRKGKTFTIRKREIDGCYLFNEDDSFGWTEEMLKKEGVKK